MHKSTDTQDTHAIVCEEEAVTIAPAITCSEETTSDIVAYEGIEFHDWSALAEEYDQEADLRLHAGRIESSHRFRAVATSMKGMV